ncbi:hypothetical protein OGATHE_003628 [Ogataea polymorpha]|uniref:Uncharacterized protein n=1 Tax=Ogataea polymorpha TaxID=460523 RepID=A0A9P8P3D0_9ASCO|nr:hypothetical protein OGATHE_003628 [Ogataea polymorpha]
MAFLVLITHVNKQFVVALAHKLVFLVGANIAKKSVVLGGNVLTELLESGEDSTAPRTFVEQQVKRLLLGVVRREVDGVLVVGHCDCLALGVGKQHSVILCTTHQTLFLVVERTGPERAHVARVVLAGCNGPDFDWVRAHYTGHDIFRTFFFMLNLSATLHFWKIVANPALVNPQLVVPTFQHLPHSIPHIRGMVLDKDNCIARDNDDRVWPAYEERWSSLKKEYPGRLLIVSNSAGTNDDVDGQAQRLEKNTGVPVLRHSTKKPGCWPEIVAWFEQRGVAPHEIAVVGDRLFTDILMANMMGSTMEENLENPFESLRKEVRACQGFVVCVCIQAVALALSVWSTVRIFKTERVLLVDFDYVSKRTKKIDVTSMIKVFQVVSLSLTVFGFLMSLVNFVITRNRLIRYLHRIEREGEHEWARDNLPDDFYERCIKTRRSTAK